MDRRTSHRRPSGPRPRLVLLALTALLLAGISASSTSGASRPLARVGLAPRLPRGSVDLGALPASERVSGALVLRPRDPEGLESLLKEVTSRQSQRYGDYLTKGEFSQRFGAAPSTVASLTARLEGDGLEVDASQGDLIRFAGRADAVDAAFATKLDRFRLADGQVSHAETSAPELPGAIAQSVATVVGLDDLQRPRRLRHAQRAIARALHRALRHTPRARAASAAFPHPDGSPKACAAAAAGAAEFGGLTDDQIANAYGAFGLYGEGDTGAGVHIGIFEQEPFAPSDIRHFDSCYFGAAGAEAMMARLQIVALEGGIPPGYGSFGEALLDVEDISAIAPGASIDVYENPETPGGEVTQIAAMVDEDRDQIISSSYGQPCEQEEEAGQPGTQEALNFLFEQAAAQGQTFVGAAGDNGSDNCEEIAREETSQPGQNPLSTGEIASQPYVLSVGGTTITEPSQPAREHVWNDGGSGGAGGGGISQSFAMPSWQRDATVPGIALPGGPDYTNAATVEQRFGYPTGFCTDTLLGADPATACRLEPDVSAQADEYTGAITVYSGQYRGEGGELAPSGWVTSGGTSSAAPIWAAMLALADASSTCRTNPSTADGIGFASPLLYAVASNPSAYASSFNDITKGNIDEYDLDEGKVYPARPGYDLASGLGSPRMTDPGSSPGLAYYLCSYAASASRPAVTSLEPSSGSTAGGEKVEVTGTGFESGGTPFVAGVQVGAWQVTEQAIHVTSATRLELVLPPALETLPAGAPATLDGAGPANVIVTLRNGESSEVGPASRFAYVDTGAAGVLPTVSGVLPYGGSESAPAPVTVLGSGFTGAKEVSFGGVASPSFKVLSDSELLVTPPAYSSATECAPLPAGGPYAGETATNDICQAQVVVDLASGASATSPILPPFEGAPSFEQDGALIAPLGCGCEIYPASSEYDYVPPPTISSVSTNDGPGSLASETGGTRITIHGAGLNRATLDYTFFHAPGLEYSMELENVNQEIAYVSGTEIQIVPPPLVESVKEASVGPRAVPFSVRTLAGETPQTPVTYAGIPRVTRVSNPANRVTLGGAPGAPDTGGVPILLHGKGLSGQVDAVSFTDHEAPTSEGTSHAVLAGGDTKLQATTVAQSPALADVRACTATGCSATSRTDRLYLYPPGAPRVRSLTPDFGSAAGGTKVTLHGKNLGCALKVKFGKTRVKLAGPANSIAGCESASALTVTSPPGTPGGAAPVALMTLASWFSGEGFAPTGAAFTYTSP